MVIQGNVDRLAQGSRAKQHVDLARVLTGVVGAVSSFRPQDDVLHTIPVQISAGQGCAQTVAGVSAEDGYVLLSQGDVERSLEGWRAEDNVGLPGALAAVVRAVGSGSADEEVIDAVAVDIAAGHRCSQIVLLVGGCHCHIRRGGGEVQNAAEGRGTKDDIDLAAVLTGVARDVGSEGGHYEVVDAVGV